MAMVDQLPAQIKDTFPQMNPTLIKSPSEQKTSVLMKNDFINSSKGMHALKVEEHQLFQALKADAGDKIQKNFTLDSRFICLIASGSSIVVKSMENSDLSLEIKNIPSKIRDISIYEESTFSLLGIVCKDGNILAYKMEINQNKDQIILNPLLNHRVEGQIEQTQLMWKSMNKLGVILRNELILIEISPPPENKKNKGAGPKDQLKPGSFNILRFDKQLKDFCFSPRYALVYLLFDDNTVAVVNTENGVFIREFAPHGTANVLRLVIFRNLEKPEPARVAGQKVKLKVNHDFSLKDVFITVTENLEVKVWDLREWDDQNKSYYCLETLQLMQNFSNCDSQSKKQIFFDLKRNSLFVTCLQGLSKETNVIALHTNRFFHTYQEDYNSLKKSKNFFESISKILFEKPNISELAAVSIENVQSKLYESDLESSFSFVIQDDKNVVLLSISNERIAQSPTPELQKNENFSFQLTQGNMNIEGLIELQVQKALNRYINNIEDAIERKINQRISEFTTENYEQKIVHQVDDTVKKEVSATINSYFEEYSNRIFQKVDRALEEQRKAQLDHISLQEQQQTKVKEEIDQNLKDFATAMGVWTQVVSNNQNCVGQMQNILQGKTFELTDITSQIQKMLERERDFCIKLSSIEKDVHAISAQFNMKNEPVRSPIIIPNNEPIYPKAVGQSGPETYEPPGVSDAFKKVMQDLYTSLMRTGPPEAFIPPSVLSGYANSLLAQPNFGGINSATTVSDLEANQALRDNQTKQSNPGFPIARVKSLPEPAGISISTAQQIGDLSPYVSSKGNLSPHGIVLGINTSQQQSFNEINQIPFSGYPAQMTNFTQMGSKSMPMVPNYGSHHRSLSYGNQQDFDNNRVDNEQFGNSAGYRKQTFDYVNEFSPGRVQNQPKSTDLLIDNVFSFQSTPGPNFNFVNNQIEKSEEPLGKPPGLSWDDESQDSENLLPRNLLQDSQGGN